MVNFRFASARDITLQLQKRSAFLPTASGSARARLVEAALEAEPQ